MSFTQRLIKCLEAGLFQPIRVILGANKSYPYHDFVTFDDTDEPCSYRVGRNQLNLRGDQQKLFVSKETGVISDVECTIRFNDANNTPITIRANTPMVFESNISMVYVTAIGAGGYIDFHFEGVLPQETRDAQ